MELSLKELHTINNAVKEFEYNEKVNSLDVLNFTFPLERETFSESVQQPCELELTKSCVRRNQYGEVVIEINKGDSL